MYNAEKSLGLLPQAPKVIIFGGTTEGRQLCESCAQHGVAATYCTATLEGARLVENLQGIETRIGRLESAQMATMIESARPAVVFDATHPYAQSVSRNIAFACKSAGAAMLRVARDTSGDNKGLYFGGIDSLIDWLKNEKGNIFVTLGSSYAGRFTALPDFRERIWIRILPTVDSLRACLDFGYRTERIICMQGPFSEELNRAMFKEADARILVSKNSGIAGGFPEKARAAEGLGMITAILERSLGHKSESSDFEAVTDGITLQEAHLRIKQIGEMA